MSEVRLVLRDAEREISGTCHGSLADRAIAALSAEPETIAELGAALGRFERPPEHGFWAGFRPGVNDEPYDAGLVVIDLAARLVASDSTYSSASHRGTVLYHNGKSATDISVHYRLPDDWQITSDAWNWSRQADSARRERLAHPAVDARTVLYGRPLLEFIARECFQAFHMVSGDIPVAIAEHEIIDDANWRSFDDDGPPLSEAEHLAIQDIHARWLLGPRGDLGERSPREILLAKQKFIDGDLQDREFQWTQQGACPPGLDRAAHAYRYGGFGTHEIVIYYYLVRRLIRSCREQLAVDCATPQAALMTAGDFLTGEVNRLSRVRDDWLDTPDGEYHGRTPRSIIDRERRRLPEGMSAEEAIIDHDCPLCQMMADGLSGPMFWHLDGCNMDWEFAFSFAQTRDEWEQEQREWEAFNRKFKAEEAERTRLEVKYPGGGYADPNYTWERSFVADDGDGVPLELRLFGIGANLAELIVDLKQPTEDRPLIDRLSRDFGNLREVARGDDLASAAALAEPVVHRFCETLADVAATREHLRAKCDDLTQRLRRFFELPAEEQDAEPFDDDVPF